jgi:glycosyltransferase involved in cell wall biosynthesis
MKIIIYWEQESWGGVDSHLVELLRSWPEQRDEIVLLFNQFNLGYQRVKKDLEKIPGLKFREIRSFSRNQINDRMNKIPLIGRLITKITFLLSPMVFIFSVLVLYMQFKPYKNFDVLLASNGAYPGAWGSLASLFAGQLLGMPVRIMLVHHSASRFSTLFGWFEEFLDKKISEISSAVICVSKATKQTILERRNFNDEKVPIRVIYNGVNPDFFPANLVVDIKSIASVEKSVALAGIIGRIEPYKGHEDLLFALARLNQLQRAQIKVLVIGVGEPLYVDYLKKLAETLNVDANIEFAGYIPGDSSDIILQLDLLLMLTRTFEGFGLTVAEAIRHNVPVIATAVGAVEEFFAADNGTLINPCAPKEIANALVDYLNNRSKFNQNKYKTSFPLNISSKVMSLEYRQIFWELLVAAHVKEGM